MSILESLFKGFLAVGDALVTMDEKFDAVERKMNKGKTFDESLDDVERKLLKGKTVNEIIYKK